MADRDGRLRVSDQDHRGAPMAFTHQVELHGNATFRGRVKMAMFTAARTVLGQANPGSGQLRAAQHIIDRPDDALERAMNALVGDATVAAEATADSTGTGITDTELQTAVNSALLALVR